eukprot:647771-Pelagomonas_calceolata.AAC.2
MASMPCNTEWAGLMEISSACNSMTNRRPQKCIFWGVMHNAVHQAVCHPRIHRHVVGVFHAMKCCKPSKGTCYLLNAMQGSPTDSPARYGCLLCHEALLAKRGYLLSSERNAGITHGPTGTLWVFLLASVSYLLIKAVAGTHYG